jgi:hypothetical protein
MSQDLKNLPVVKILKTEKIVSVIFQVLKWSRFGI